MDFGDVGFHTWDVVTYQGLCWPGIYNKARDCSFYSTNMQETSWTEAWRRIHAHWRHSHRNKRRFKLQTNGVCGAVCKELEWADTTVLLRNRKRVTAEPYMSSSSLGMWRLFLNKCWEGAVMAAGHGPFTLRSHGRLHAPGRIRIRQTFMKNQTVMIVAHVKISLPFSAHSSSVYWTFFVFYCSAHLSVHVQTFSRFLFLVSVTSAGHQPTESHRKKNSRHVSFNFFIFKAEIYQTKAK